MPDTFTTIWQRLLLRAPAVGASFSQDLVRDAFQQLAERRQWSWLMRSSAFYSSTFNQAGTANVTPGSALVIGGGTAWTQSMVGAQFRIGNPPSNYPTYTIAAVLGPTALTLTSPWVGPTISNATFQIFQCYFAVPSDFQYFVSLVNTTANYRLWTNITQAEIDLADPQRVQTGISYAAAFYDYTQTFQGTVGQTLQTNGNGANPAPVSTTAVGFTYPANSIYTVQITSSGGVGTAFFQWKQDSGSYTTNVMTNSAAIDLSNGVQVFFPTGNYNSGDTWVIPCTASAQAGVPRYELWPRPIDTPYVYPYIYCAKLPALSDSSPTLPEFVAQRGDVLLEMALTNCARYPGTDTTKNPYYDLALSRMHETKAERLIYELEKKDDDTAIKDLAYQNLPFYPAPWLDGSWLQTHAIYPNP